MSEEIDLLRELAELNLATLATERRALREEQARKDAACTDAKAALEAAEAPFAEKLGTLRTAEEAAEAEAVQALLDFEEHRRTELLAGHECARPALPAGVSVKWLESPIVVDAAAVPAGFHAVDLKLVKLFIKETETVPDGIELFRKPSIAVKEAS